jgi:hypothetical protein
MMIIIIIIIIIIITQQQYRGPQMVRSLPEGVFKPSSSSSLLLQTTPIRCGF